MKILTITAPYSYPGTTFIDHILRYNADPNVKIIVLLGEVCIDLHVKYNQRKQFISENAYSIIR